MIRGELVENRVVIWDVEEARRVFKEGFYGKPLGIPKPKAPDFNAPLILDLIEGFYLAKKGRLSIYKGAGRTPVRLDAIKEICEKEYVDFPQKFLVYREIREAGLVVTPGIKFGCDFAVYVHGPGIDHAPYLVEVVKPSGKMTATGTVLAGRLATTVRKQFIIAVADVKKQKVNFISFDWWRA